MPEAAGVAQILALVELCQATAGLNNSTHQKIRRLKNQPFPLKVLNPPENPDTQFLIADISLTIFI